jgi:hypothetical protein
MNRRTFLKIVGGGIILSATAGIAGCTSDMPPEAIAAWKGPGAEPDICRWILSHAILAPHSHNLQSWLVDLKTPGEITLYCDTTRLLPETDPYFRQIMMSHGTFLELLDIAARQRGYRTDIRLFPKGALAPGTIDNRPVARVRLLEDAGVPQDPLFPQILKRHTSREPYDITRNVPAAALQTMVESIQMYPVRFGSAGLEQSELLVRHRAIAAAAWQVELTTPDKILETFRWLRVGGSEIARHRDGISINDPFVTMLARLGMFDRTKAPKPDDTATVDQIKSFNRLLHATPAFLWLVTDDNERSTQISAGRAYVRVQLAGSAHGISMQPLQQALQEYPEQQANYNAIHNLLEAPRPQHTVQMWARVGFGLAIGPAPRRGLQEHVIR